jgi:uncharacterized protein
VELHRLINHKNHCIQEPIIFSFLGRKQLSDHNRTGSLSLFPLATTLFPGGRLSLKVFEQRYYEMAKRCITSGERFGIVSLSAGNEVGADQSFAKVGTSAAINTFDAPSPNMFVLDVFGGERFEILSTSIGRSGLHLAEVRWIETEPIVQLPAEYLNLATLLKPVVDQLGEIRFAEPYQFDDATWVGCRLAEILQLPPAIKQVLLEINDAELRLKTLAQLMARGK